MPKNETTTSARDISIRESGTNVLQEMSIEQVAQRVKKVLELQKHLMKSEIHYGVIPGTQKPTLLKPGAELMCLTFMFDPQYEHEIRQDGVHREIVAKCTLYHIPTNSRIASGEGSCSTYESKYAYRKSSPAECPGCGNGLMKSKYGKGGWYCNPKSGGCGSNFALDDPKVKLSAGGRVANPDIADQYNTVLKMANKRALIAAILNGTAASEIFTQDLEDFVDESPNDESGLNGGVPSQPEPKSQASAGAAGASVNGGTPPPSSGGAQPPPAGSHAPSGLSGDQVKELWRYCYEVFEAKDTGMKQHAQGVMKVVIGEFGAASLATLKPEQVGPVRERLKQEADKGKAPNADYPEEKRDGQGNIDF